MTLLRLSKFLVFFIFAGLVLSCGNTKVKDSIPGIWVAEKYDGKAIPEGKAGSRLYLRIYAEGSKDFIQAVTPDTKGRGVIPKSEILIDEDNDQFTVKVDPRNDKSNFVVKVEEISGDKLKLKGDVPHILRELKKSVEFKKTTVEVVRKVGVAVDLGIQEASEK